MLNLRKINKNKFFCRVFSTKMLTEETPTALDPEWLGARPFKEIPRPPKLNFLLSFLPGGKYFQKSGTELARMLQQELGDLNVMPGAFGKPDILMVFNPEAIEKAYRTEGIWPNRNALETVAYFREHVKKDFFGDTTGLIVSQGESWGRQRKAVNPILLQPRNARQYIKTLSELNDDFIERIRQVRDDVTNEVPKDFEEDINRLTFESISAIVLNRKFGLILRQQENPDILKLFKNVRDFFIYVFELEIQPSLWKYIRTPTFKKMMKCQEEIFDITEKFVKEAVEMIEEKKIEDETQEPSVLEKLLKHDKKVAIATAMDLIVAGADVTSAVLIGVLINLAEYPMKQEKLRKEVMKVLPNKNSALTSETMKSLPYLRACIKESMRYYPMAVGVFRNAGRDVVLNGYQVPEGTSMMLNSNLMLLDNKYYERPNEFIPERWFRENERTEDIHDNSHPFSFLPFGFGPRVCAGKRIVDMELEISVLKIIRNFKVEYNYSTKNAFRQSFINIPNIPLNFKFTDIH